MNRRQKKLTIGIPSTLFSSYHLPFWRQFVTLSGMEAVLSDPSGQETVTWGGRRLPHEFCVPIKVFLGHILNLLEKRVDRILLPRMITQSKTNFFCPKLIGLPEIVRYTTGIRMEQIFSPEVSCDGLTLLVSKFPSSSPAVIWRMKVAARKANQVWEDILAKCRVERLTLPEAANGPRPGSLGTRLNIGLLGYAYSLYDPFISKGIVNRLYSLGIKITTWEMLDPKQIERNLVGLKRPLFWNFGRMLLGAGFQFLNDSAIDGLIYVTTFGCGPDSVATRILSIEAGQRGKPFLQINLDEHQEDGHLRTRLEAFCDMLAALKEEQVI